MTAPHASEQAADHPVSGTPDTYGPLAQEYYDAGCHPTCANFRQASRIVLEAWIGEIWPEEGVVCDVGAGASLLAEIVHGLGLPMARLLLTDGSPAMLKHSTEWGLRGATLAVAPAENLPVATNTVGLLVASLGDPYNSREFWREAGRVLSPGAAAVYTTPAHEWATSYRPVERGEGPAAPPADNFGTALFLLRDGSEHRVPSLVLSERGQSDLIEAAGLKVEQVRHVLLSEIAGPALSPKLTITGEETEVVTGYLVRRPRGPV